MSKNLQWGSHVPVNQALLDTYDIKGVVEFGVGYHSTPLFIKQSPKVLAIETDREWIQKVQSEFEEKEEFVLLHQDISPVVRSTRRKDLTKEQLEKQYSFYRSLDLSEYNYLFIDSASSTRYAIFETIADQFDIIVLHDVNEKGLINHWNDGEGLELSGYKRFIHKTYTQQTGILLREELCSKYDQLKKRMVETTKLWGNKNSILEEWNGTL